MSPKLSSRRRAVRLAVFTLVGLAVTPMVFAVAATGDGEGVPVAPTLPRPAEVADQTTLSVEQVADTNEVLNDAPLFGDSLKSGKAQVVRSGIWTTAGPELTTLGATAIVQFDTAVDLPNSFHGVVPSGEDDESREGITVDEIGAPLTTSLAKEQLSDVTLVEVLVDLRSGKIHAVSPLN